MKECSFHFPRQSKNSLGNPQHRIPQRTVTIPSHFLTQWWSKILCPQKYFFNITEQEIQSKILSCYLLPTQPFYQIANKIVHNSSLHFLPSRQPKEGFISQDDFLTIRGWGITSLIHCWRIFKKPRSNIYDTILYLQNMPVWDRKIDCQTISQHLKIINLE